MISIEESIREAEDLIDRLGNLSIESRNSGTMDANTLQTLLAAAVRMATEQTRGQFQGMVEELNRKIDALQVDPAVEEYRDIEIVQGVSCEESLDIVKSVPEFKGDTSMYVSWRQAAVTAHKLFEPYQGSSKYYQAVAILRNKIVGSADSVLSTYNTVLNFYAILARLDFAYSDKTSIYTLEQELSTLWQGQRPIINFYDDVERKLTLIINKVIMSHEGDAALIKSLNQKYRMDALRVFISGLRKPLCDTLFSCKPTDLPSALALAQELETNQNRYNFATVYNNGLGKVQPNYTSQTHPRFTTRKTAFPNNQPSGNYPRQVTPNSPFNNQMQQPSYQTQRFYPQPRPFSRVNVQPSGTQGFGFQPNTQMVDADVSMRTVRSNFQRSRDLRGDTRSDRQNVREAQRINHLDHEEQDLDATNNYLLQEDHTSENIPFEDEINFLGVAQFSPTSNEQ